MYLKMAFTLMLLMSFGLAQGTNITTACENATYSLTTINYLNGSIDRILSPTPYGCDTAFGASIDPSIFVFEGTVILMWAILAALSFYALKIFKEHEMEETSILNTGLRIFFLSMALFFQLFMFQELGSYTERISNTIVNNSGSIATAFAGAFFWVIFLILFITFISLALDVVKRYKQGKRNEKEQN